MDFEKKRESRDEELDRFWDIASLVPPKKKPSFSARTPDTATAEIELTPKKSTSVQETAKAESIPSANTQPIRRFIPPHTAEEEAAKPKPQEEYTPNNALIRSVRIYRPRSDYRYYEAFLRDAVRLYPIHGEECERVPFFSYVPQYSQMNRPQLEWYLWWRECVRRGEYLQTDYSYILLYLYELINLSARLAPTAVQHEMLRIWEHYRDTYRQLDGYLSEWICDHGLLHRLSVPTDFPKKLFSVAMTHGTFKEYYFSSESANGYAGALIAFCNNYDYKKSKFYPENAAIFDQCIPTVVNKIVDAMSEEGKLFANTRMDDSRIMRNAFSGALCAYSLKRNIEVTYCSFSRSNELRYFITDVIKYTENFLRAHLGIRSRLSVYSLPNGTRELIDAVLLPLLPKRHMVLKSKKAEPIAEYEKLYDLPHTPLSLSNAAEIEKSSWSTTERLIEAFEEEHEEISMPVEIPLPVIEPVLEEPTAHTTDFAPYFPFLYAVLEEDSAAQRSAAKQMGKLPDAVADEINELAISLLGDILIEDNGMGVYAAIPDYTDRLKEIINGNQ